MKNIIALFFLSVLMLNTQAQDKFLTKTGNIKFYSHTLVEDITAEIDNAGSIINSETGEVIISLTMINFDFEKKLMQEHFNENYVESEKYPKSGFKGSITNNDEVDYGKKGTYKVTVKGDMTIHGVTNTLSTEGTIEVVKGGIVAKTTFKLNPEDYDIKIPKIVRNKIANDLEITVNMSYSPI